jgi:NAD(P)-dependent dehydrogenase (short-subunit alcohol dehydrogenase family)
MERLAGDRNGGGFQCRDVAPGRRTEHARILAAELRRAFIAHLPGGALGVGGTHHHQVPGLKQAKLLLVLQWRHRSERLELLVECRRDQARSGVDRAFSPRIGRHKLCLQANSQPDSLPNLERNMTAAQSTDSIKKIAIVTGGSRGLGRNTVHHLAKRGVNSVFTYHSNRTEAEKVVAMVAEQGQTAIALPLDTGKVSTFDAFVKQVQEVLPRLGAQRFDYLVNNAGTSNHTPFEQTTEEELDDLYDIHFKGVFFLTQKLLPLINDGGRIVNISTGLTRIAVPGSGSYASMKGAVEVLTRYLAKELGPRRIAVNTVAPGAIATDFSGGMVRDNPEINKRVADMTALGRVGLPDDIGPMIAALLSEDNRWVNAQRIEVSGGLMI